ncbi:MAG: formate dehydrogenase accessory sulfurtransferase FdhD [Dehalococcoidia bacterium]|jgi:FdhD protein
MHYDKLKILKVVDSEKVSQTDSVIRETEVVIKIDGKVHRRLTGLAEHLEELALGYLFDEGIASPSDIDITVEGNTILVSRKRRSRMRKPDVIDSDLQATDAQILSWAEELGKNCPLHIKTGGTHIVGIAHGDIMFFVEDISRHCAIDKAIGLAIRNGFEMCDCVIVTSCRQTISAMKKVVRVGIPIVVTIAAPTTLAVAEAVDYGVTLVGFVRGGQFNIYSHPHRIVTGSR